MCNKLEIIVNKHDSKVMKKKMAQVMAWMTRQSLRYLKCPGSI